jgi:hypothetical protein
MLKRKHTYLFLFASLVLLFSLVWLGGCPTGTVSQQYTLNVNISPSGGGSVTPSGGQYPSGTALTLTAIPASGYDFDYWSGSASGTNSTTTIIMDSNKNVSAYFVSTATVLFSDDFTYDTGIWYVFSDADGEVFFQNGQLHVKNYTSSLFSSHSWPWQWFDDFILEVETQLISGTANNWHAITVRDDDSGSNYYDFAINANGYYGIWKFVNGSSTELASGSSSHIYQGLNNVNLIHIECVGNRLSLSVNGYLLDEVYDSTYSAGDISLGARSHDGSYTEVAYDNIVVFTP